MRFPTLTIRQREIATGVVALALSVGVALAAEGALRAKQVLAFGTLAPVDKADTFHIDPETGLRLPVPGSRQGTIRINSLGYRGPELAMPKPPGVIRIAFLGTSTTFDPYTAHDNRTWPAVATARLAAAFGSSCRFDYLNAGVPGFGTERMIQYFMGRIRRAQPDIVVTETSDMNGRLNDLAQQAGLLEATRYQPSWLAEHSLFWGKLEKTAVVIRLQRAARTASGKLRLAGKDLTSAFTAHLTKLIDVIRSADAQPVMVLPGGQLRAQQSPAAQVAAADTELLYMPYMSIDGLIEGRMRFNQAITNLTGRMDVPLVRWTEDVPGTTKYFHDAAHFKPAGSQLMGASVAAHMLANPVMKAFFARHGCHAAPPAESSG